MNISEYGDRIIIPIIFLTSLTCYSMSGQDMTDEKR